jgi:dTDP-4-amino-4,6-dideoxygalactose transaminase
MDVPLCDLTQQYLALKDEIDAAMQGVAAEGKYILGPNVAALEQEIAAYCECRCAVAVNSGTDALHLALRSLEIGPGDEVITTPFTFIATSEAIRMVGARPVFVDIDPRTYNLDPAAVELAVTRRTKAVLPVHLFGQPCDMDPLLKLAEAHGLAIVEDCAQSIGATYRGRKTGSFGAAGCLSFFPSKNLGCFGDGGLVSCNDDTLARRLRSLRNHGSETRHQHDEIGYNSRLDELQAVVLRIKLDYIEEYNVQRRRVARRYRECLADCPVQCPVEDGRGEHVYHQFTLLCDHRERLAEALAQAGVASAIYYPTPLHRQEALQSRARHGALPVCESVARRCLSLPIYPELRDEQVEYIAGVIRSVADVA